MRGPARVTNSDERTIVFKIIYANTIRSRRLAKDGGSGIEETRYYRGVRVRDEAFFIAANEHRNTRDANIVLDPGLNTY
jgi:hypothetical protein